MKTVEVLKRAELYLPQGWQKAFERHSPESYRGCLEKWRALPLNWGSLSWCEGAKALQQSWKSATESCPVGVSVSLPSGCCPGQCLEEKGGMRCSAVRVHAGPYVKCFSVLCSSTAVISAHPIHSLDNPHHHFHSGSLASPTRSYLHHQVSPWPIGTSMSHSDRANSTGEM